MIEVHTYKDKTEEKCRLKCLDDLDAYSNELLSKEYEEDNNYVMEVVKKSDVSEFINEYLTEITKQMGIDAKINIMEEDGIFNVKMYSDSNPILIGKDGRTLNALQILIRQTLSNKIRFNVKVNLDASNYKQRKEKYFERNIKDIINDVIKNKVETKLDPMNSYTRRLVHSIASDYYNIETESFGEEPNRYVVIRYVEK